MKASWSVAVLVGGLVFLTGPTRADGTAFTYQGRLMDDGAPAQGTYAFKVRLMDAPDDGAQVGSIFCEDGVVVINGLFELLLDFGLAAADANRFLEIRVKKDGNCADTSDFVYLLPRQQIRPTPSALNALTADQADQAASANLAGHAGTADVAGAATRLDAPDGSPTGAVFVDANGNVGIGTTAPVKRLTVSGDMEVGTSSGDYRHLRIGGGNSSGFLYGSFPAYADGIHIGYNFYADAAGVPRVSNAGGETSRITMGYGAIRFALGGVNAEPIDYIHITPTGLGILDPTPDANLDVAGNIHYSGTITDVSDERLKENITPVRDALGKLRRLRGVYFTMKDTPGQREVGLIAQDVQEVLPEAVRVVEPDGGYLGVSYPAVIPLLVEAIKEVQDKSAVSDAAVAMSVIEELHKTVREKDRRLEELSCEISSLKSEISELREWISAQLVQNGGSR